MEGFVEEGAYELGSQWWMWLDSATVARRQAFQTEPCTGGDMNALSRQFWQRQGFVRER